MRTYCAGTHVSASITSRSHAVLFIIIFLQLSGAPAKQLRSFQSAAHNEMRTLCLGSLVLRGGGSSRHIADRRAGLVCGPFSLTRDESVNGTASEGSQALAEVNLLAKERERIEEAISDTKQGLARMGAPDHTPGHFSEQYVPLLDAEGYPRNDIPVLEILESRKTLAALRLERDEVAASLDRAMQNYFRQSNVSVSKERSPSIPSWEDRMKSMSPVLQGEWNETDYSSYSECDPAHPDEWSVSMREPAARS